MNRARKNRGRAEFREAFPCGGFASRNRAFPFTAFFSLIEKPSGRSRYFHDPRHARVSRFLTLETRECFGFMRASMRERAYRSIFLGDVVIDFALR